MQDLLSSLNGRRDECRENCLVVKESHFFVKKKVQEA
jgi:hypothetical protein